ncbi:flagellar hook assembly protein FlgD [Jatrophihabitans endophyticus]|uniref:flagellar hook assembly protein FlgD n=1 Tax=Jatrophihabitans endophyticus TaxID=1206085 RepID=UPI001A0722FC|nr:flagellar hook assembly protein FlgD [Jatrophihabitans endophyticus]MBE7188750.1 flagellar hook assembly protein FlgD [Jatrophihabitans endophyticus]
MGVTSVDLASAAQTAAKKTSAANATAAKSDGGTSTTNADALSSLTSNYNQFLSLLTAQLQHQDPTSPMQTENFTSELAQFAGVEQQIKTNTNLGQILSLNQESQVTQGTELVGKRVVASDSVLPLQNGQATLQLSPTAAGAVAIGITDASGKVVRTQGLTLGAGTTSWTWDGKNDEGDALPDGSYDVAVVTANGSGAASAVPFGVVGTVTGVVRDASGTVQVQMGPASVDLGKVSSVS